MQDEIQNQQNKRSRQFEQVIAALLSTATVRDAAKAAGIGETTIYRMMQDPAFAESYKQVRQKFVANAIEGIQHLIGIASKTLLEIMEDQAAPTSSRVAACRTVLDMGLKSLETQAFSERIADIERTLEGAMMNDG